MTDPDLGRETAAPGWGRTGFRLTLAAVALLTAVAISAAPGGPSGGKPVEPAQAAAAGPQVIEVRLRVPKGARQVGTAVLSAVADGKARVQVELTEDLAGGLPGAAAALVRPARIVVGTCANNSGVTQFGLSNVALGRSETTVQGATLPDLYNGKFSIVVTRSLDERNTSVACGEVVGG